MKSLSLVFAVVFVTTLLASPAVAQDGVQWVPSLKEALKQAKERGCLIFIGMTMENEESNTAQKEAYRDPAFVKASKDFVCVFANPNINTSVEVMVDGKKVRRCADALTITCDEARNCYSEVRKNYDRNTDSTGAVKMPYQMILDGDGKFLHEIINGSVEGGFDVCPGPALAEVFRKLVAQYGKGLSVDQYQKLKGVLSEAEAARKKGDLKKAAKLCKEIIDANERSALADQAKKLIEKIDAVAKNVLEEAVAKIDKDPIAAILALEEVVELYQGTDAAKQAKQKIAELRKRKDVKKLLTKLKKEKEAAGKIAAAEKLVESGDYLKALAALKSVARKYKGTSAAEKATARVAELEGDEEIARKIRDMEAEKFSKRVLAMGRNYAKNGMTDKARAEFQKIIDKYPESTFAEEAKQELEKLK
jgi:hypothetical protein